MAYKVQKACRVCGKMYTPCADCENDKTSFHWRTVACSEECGKEYLRRINESRKPQKTKPEKQEDMAGETGVTYTSASTTKKNPTKKKALKVVEDK